MADKDLVVKCAVELADTADSDVLLISGDVFGALESEALTKIRSRQNPRSKVILLLATPGGSADSAYRISRALQSRYKHVTALVAGWCKSAGTLCVIGAHELVMSDGAELGPLDVQLARPDEIGERDSGLVLNEALGLLQQEAFRLFEEFMLQIKNRSDGQVTLRMATEIASTVTKGLFEPIYRQIDPYKIGEAGRSLAIAIAYGNRLNLHAKNLRPDSLENLTQGYPSHGFVIDRREAEQLFNAVRPPNTAETNLVSALGRLASVPSPEPLVIFLSPETADATERSKEDRDGSAKAQSKRSGSKRRPRSAPKASAGGAEPERVRIAGPDVQDDKRAA